MSKLRAKVILEVCKIKFCSMAYVARPTVYSSCERLTSGYNRRELMWKNCVGVGTIEKERVQKESMEREDGN